MMNNNDEQQQPTPPVNVKDYAQEEKERKGKRIDAAVSYLLHRIFQKGCCYSSFFFNFLLCCCLYLRIKKIGQDNISNR